MKLITENGQLDLPAAFSFGIEQNSPVFSHEGTQSIPATLPVSAKNLKALGFPTRIGRREKYLRKLPAKIDAGIFQKDGQLVVDTAGNKSGITGAIMLNESDLYSKIKDVKLTEIFEKIIRNDFAADPDPVESWYNHIYNCMKGSVYDDFTTFPVAVNYDDTTGYEVLNRPDFTSGLDPWKLVWEARDVTDGDNTISLPKGYGITPFLWFYRVIELIFSEYGYTIGSNPFKDNLLLKKKVLINNTADVICKGVVKYSDLVPSCTVSEFLIFIEMKYLTHAYIYPESKTVDIIPLQTILEGSPDLDITHFVNGEIKQTFSDAQEVSISSDTDLEGAAPASDTIFELGKKYTVLTELGEAAWRSYDWTGLSTWEHHLILRKATGQYYDILFRRLDGPTNIKLLGSNYFTFFQKKLPAKEYEAEDIMPPVVLVTLGLVGELEANIMCLYIGDSRHINTVADKTEESDDQKIIIAYAAGRAEEEALPAYNSVYRGTIASKYFFGTTQKYNNAGNAWCDFDLTTTDLYELFFKKWNDIIKNSGTEIECKVDFPDKHLFSLKLDRMKLLKGQLLLPISLSYNVSNKITHNTSKYMLVKSQEPIITDEIIPFRD